MYDNIDSAEMQEVDDIKDIYEVEASSKHQIYIDICEYLNLHQCTDSYDLNKSCAWVESTQEDIYRMGDEILL